MTISELSAQLQALEAEGHGAVLVASTGMDEYLNGNYLRADVRLEFVVNPSDNKTYLVIDAGS